MGSSTSKPVKYLPQFEADLPSLKGKTVAITGCTSGTGLVAAKVMVRKGVDNILLLNRSSTRAEAAEAEIKKEIPEGASTTVETISCDLQDFESVKAAATTIKSKYEAVDVLCCNAGIMAMEDRATKDGYDVQQQTNHLSHFLLTKELFPLVQRAQELRGDARIFYHSSASRKGGLLEADKYFAAGSGGNLGGNSTGAKWERYHQSKLANVVMTLALRDKLKAAGSGIKAVCAAPGYSVTGLQTKSEGMNGMLWTRIMAQSAEDGTMPLLLACFGPDVESGDFYEPSKYSNFSGPAKKFELTKECTHEESRQALWDASEAACGKFEISK